MEFFVNKTRLLYLNLFISKEKLQYHSDKEFVIKQNSIAEFINLFSFVYYFRKYKMMIT